MTLEMLNQILGTYDALISQCYNLPGAKLEDLWSSEAIAQLKEERQAIRELQADLLKFTTAVRKEKP